MLFQMSRRLPRKLNDVELRLINNNITTKTNLSSDSIIFFNEWITTMNYFISQNYPLDLYVKSIPTNITNIYNTEFGEPPSLRPFSLDEINLIKTVFSGSNNLTDGQQWIIISWLLQANEIIPPTI